MKPISEMIEVMQAFERGETIEYFNYKRWHVLTSPSWNWEMYDYRVKQKTKPSINPEHVAEEWKWLAKDASGDCYLYKDEPVKDDASWFNYPSHCANGFSSLVPGNCDWQDSLVRIRD